MRTIFSMTLLLIVASCVAAQPPWVEQQQREHEAEKRFYEQMREQLKRQREHEREGRKQLEETFRESAKKQAEWEKEAFKHRDEQQRERDKFYAEQWREYAKHQAEMYREFPGRQGYAWRLFDRDAPIAEHWAPAPRMTYPPYQQPNYRVSGEFPTVPPGQTEIPLPGTIHPQTTVPPTRQAPQNQKPVLPFGNPYDPPPINYGPQPRPAPQYVPDPS